MKKYNYLEVCSGCGGLSYGLECSGLNPYALIEIEKNCIKTLKANFKCENIIESDLRKIDFSQYKNKIDILVGGIPCQSFSIAGKREGLQNGNKGGLFYDFLQILEKIKPKMFMIENVEGLQNINNGETLKSMILEPEKLEFNVYHKVLDSRYYNVPQKRRRLIIIGTTLSVEFEFPKPNEKILTMRDALLNVPDSNGVTYPKRKKEIMDLIPAGGCWIDLPDDIKKEYMGKSLDSGGGKRGIAKRLSWEEPCLTLTTSPCQKQTERCHPDETRPLKIREYARIQTFPDSFKFEGSTLNIYKQIGNAVPCMLGYYIGRSIRNTLYKIEEKKLIYKILVDILLKKNTVKKPTVMDNIQNLVKKFYMNHIIKIYEEEIDRTKTKIDEIKKSSDMISYEMTEEEWIQFDNTRLKDKQINNKIGELHQFLMENMDGFCKANNIDKDLKIDIMKKDYSIFIELKNKYNSMNSSSKESAIKKLMAIKKKYPNALCLIGIVNGRNYKKKLEGEDEIWEYSGEQLFELIFQNKDYYKHINDILNKNLKEWILEYKKNIDPKGIENKKVCKLAKSSG